MSPQIVFFLSIAVCCAASAVIDPAMRRQPLYVRLANVLAAGVFGVSIFATLPLVAAIHGMAPGAHPALLLGLAFTPVVSVFFGWRNWRQRILAAP